MRLRTYITIACGTVGVGGAGAPLMAQSSLSEPIVITVDASRVQQSDSGKEQKEDALTTKVSINLADVPLRVVLESLIEKSGVQVLYSSMVPLDRRVTVRGEQITLESALRQALAGIALSPRISPDGQVIIVRARVGKEERAAEGVITGRVVSAKTKQPVAKATVTIGTELKVVTGEDGRFRVQVEAGEHTVTVRAVGMTKQSKTVTVSEDETASVEFVLEANANVLDEVVVTGSVVATKRKTIPTPITVITGKDLEERGITQIDQILRGQVPGVFAVDQGTQVYSRPLTDLNRVEVYSRGASTTEGGATPLKIYVDGVELVDPELLGTVDTRGIERIEVITGPQAATIYGAGAMGGVMQIFMKNGAGQPREVSLRLRYGAIESNIPSSGRTPVHAQVLRVTGGTGPGASYSASLSHDYQGQWQPGLFSRRGGFSAGLVQRQGAFNVSGSLSITGGQLGNTSKPPSEQALMATGEYIESNKRFAPSNMLLKTESRSFARQLSLNIDYNALPWWQHHLTLGESNVSARVLPQAPWFMTPVDTLFVQSRSNNGSMTYGYNTSIVRRTGVLSHSLVLGMNGNTSGGASNLGRTASSNTGAWERNAYLQVTTNDARSIGGFGTWKVGVLDHLFLTLGLRGQHSPAYGREHKIDWTPTNGLSYVLEFGDVTLKLMGSYGRATRTPPADARERKYMFFAAYNPSTWESQREALNLRPEVNRGPQGGFELYLGNRGSIALNRYRETVDDLLTQLLVDSTPRKYVSNPALSGWHRTYQWINVDRVVRQGWEGRGTLNLGPLSLEGTWSWNESRVTRSRSQSIDRLQNTGVPTHTGNGIIRYAYGATSVNLTMNFTGAYIGSSLDHPILWWEKERRRLQMYGQRETGRSFAFTQSGYVRSNLNMSHRLSSNVSMTVSVMNLGNSFASEGGVMSPTMGRRTTLAVTLRR